MATSSSDAAHDVDAIAPLDAPAAEVSSFETDRVARRMAHPVMAWSRHLLLALAVACVGAALFGSGASLIAVVCLLVLRAAVGSVDAFAVERLGRLSVSKLGVFFDAQRLGPALGARAEIVLQPNDAPLVRVKTGGRRFVFRVEDEALAQRVVASLTGAAPSGPSKPLRLASPVHGDPGQLARFAIYAVVLTLAFPLVGLTWHVDPRLALTLLAVAIAAGAGLVAGLLVDTVVTVAPEGLRIGWMRGGRLLRFADIVSAELLDELDLAGAKRTRVLVITLRGGETVRLPCDGADAEAVAEVLRAARRGSTNRATTSVEALVRSRGQAPEAWLGALRGLVAGAASTHRRAPVGDAALWQVVEDADAPSDARAGAAVALLEGAAEDPRDRLRVAAGGAPSRLRFAIEAAADATTDVELEGALLEVIAYDEALAEERAPRKTD
jgi:hypothetical protein